MAEIGATLREARMRAHIDISEIEMQTKIRAKYLRALENEEWGLLPGPTYAKSFLRAYAQALGLDAKSLIDEYKERFERPGEPDRSEQLRTTGRNRTGSRQAADNMRAPLPRSVIVGATLAALVVLLALIGFLTGVSANNNTAGGSNASNAKVHHGVSTVGRPRGTGSQLHHHQGASSPPGQSVELSLQATGRVWVCLTDGAKRTLIPGLILEPSESVAHNYRGRVFDLLLGDNAVTLSINHKRISVPESSTAIAYSISSAGAKPVASGSIKACS